MSVDRSDDLLIETSKQQLAKVLSRHARYVVPRFQRDYSWGVYQCEQLFDDVKYSCETQTSHFLGNMVFRPSSQRNENEIIDGQQRLCSILLLALAATMRFSTAAANGEDKELNEYRVTVCKELFWTRDTSTFELHPRLQLSRRNHAHYLKMFQKLTAPTVKDHRLTNQKLNGALKFFIRKFEDMDYDEVASMVDNLTSNVFVTVTTVDNLTSAYSVFESLNSKGTSLQVADLVKNFLMGKIASGTSDQSLTETKLDNVEKKWNSIIDHVGEADAGDFLRTVEIFNLKGNLIHMKRLFKNIDNRIKTPRQANNYLTQLKVHDASFAALLGKNEGFWKTKNKKYKESVPALETMNAFRVKSPVGLFLAALQVYEPEDFNYLVENIMKFTVRYNVICNNPFRKLENSYAQLAHKIISGNMDATSVVKAVVDGIYPTKTEFCDEFIRMNIDSKAKTAYFLKEIEKGVSGIEELKHANVAKIMPDSPGNSWKKDLNGTAINDLSDRICNFRLINGDGREHHYRDFLDFQSQEAKSRFAINRNVAKQKNWDEKSLRRHELWLAKNAEKVWGVEKHLLDHD